MARFCNVFYSIGGGVVICSSSNSDQEHVISMRRSYSFICFFSVIFDAIGGGVSNVNQNVCITSGPPKLIDFSVAFAAYDTGVLISP